LILLLNFKIIIAFGHNQLHNCVCGALSIKDGGVIYILVKSLRRRIFELQLLWWFYIIQQC